MVVARSSVSCRRFQRGARGVDARGACCVRCRDGFERLLVKLSVGSARVTKFPRLQMTRFLLASNFLEAHAGDARRVRITGKRCAESVSNRFALVHPLLRKAKII